jgi:hypothetical protein
MNDLEFVLFIEGLLLLLVLLGGLEMSTLTSFLFWVDEGEHIEAHCPICCLFELIDLLI